MLCGSNLPNDCLSKTFKNTRVCQMISVTYCCQITYRNAPCRTRTCDRRIRNPLLYPAELRALFDGLIRRSEPGNTDRRQANGQGDAIQRAETRPQYLYRHNESGRYYVRAFRQGKELAFTDVGNQEWFISDLAGRVFRADQSWIWVASCSVNPHPPAGLEGLESPGRRSP